MNKWILNSILTLTLAFGAVSVDAKPLTEAQQAALKDNKKLRDQMNSMVVSIADLDILINRDNVMDYDIFQDDAERILKAIAKIRKLDDGKVYKPFLDQLEKPAQNLLNYSKAKDPKAKEATNAIFDACFSCHKAHRSKS